MDIEEVRGLAKRAAKMREAEMGTMREAFQKLDCDGGGTLSTDEMRMALCELLQEEEIELLLKGMDGDGDGEIDYEVSWEHA